MKRSSIVKLRTIIGLTQREFAVLTGISLVTIKSVEKGKRKLGPPLIRQITAATGLMPEALAREDRLLDLSGKQYGRESYSDWLRRAAGYESSIEGNINSAAAHVSALLYAAHNTGRFLQVCMMLNERVQSLRYLFGLEEVTKKFMPNGEYWSSIFPIKLPDGVPSKDDGGEKARSTQKRRTAKSSNTSRQKRA